MRILFWIPTLQADVQALAYHLAGDPDVEVFVAVDHPQRYLAEPVASLLPFAGTIVDRTTSEGRQAAERFGADLVIVDNNPPPPGLAPRIAVVWHGFGWRVDQLDPVIEGFGRLVGDVRRPNPRFRWFATGEFDRQHRVERWGLAPENVVALGAPFSDWVLADSPIRARVPRSAVSSHYTVDVVGRPTLLLGLTWHFGAAFEHWGDDDRLLDRYLQHVGARGANVIHRLHDRRRYRNSYLRRVRRLARRHQHVQVKFKDESPDTLVDVLCSDVMVSNYSSFLNTFYFTGGPSVHIDPTPPGLDTYPLYRTLRFRHLTTRKADDPEGFWKLPFSEHGGLRATSFDELLDLTDVALGDPSCCQERSRAFVERYYTGVDGRTCERYRDHLATWLGGAEAEDGATPLGGNL